MAPFYPLYLRRSDGKVAITDRNGQVKERNEPTAEQLDAKPNAQGISDFYRESCHGDSKETDWRRKLGGMLIREIGKQEPKDRNYVLAALPENYRVYEHVKCRLSGTDNQTTKVVKNHAAGSNERQDAYLYGHPAGRKKRYRSPAEFFPHLLWLATDEAGDPNNCSCKYCSPEEIDSGEKAPAKVTTKEIRQDTKPAETTKPLAKPAATTAPPRRTSSDLSASAAQTPSPLPRFKSLEQKLDAQPNKLLYRTGEIVWFSRGSAWGLGVISKREVQQGQYRVQPLSHPQKQPALIMCGQQQLRPWLAWSPPPCTHAELNPSSNNHNRMLTFDTVDWDAVVAGRYGQGDAEVDGSILASKRAETTFTPFDPVTTSAPANPTEIHYNGLYLGGEKIWVGDPVRLRHGAFSTDIMILHDIIEQPSSLPNQSPRITLTGDTYCYRVVQLEPKAVPRDELHLPARVRDDLAFRNRITMSPFDTTKRFSSFWRLNVKGARLDIADVKGRWYESSALMPVLDPAGFNRARAQGEVQDAGLYMNGQGDCNRPPPGTPGAGMGKDGAPKSRPADTKVARREDAFGRAVPVTFRVHRGLDEPKTETKITAKAQVDPATKSEVKGEESTEAKVDQKFEESRVAQVEMPLAMDTGPDTRPKPEETVDTLMQDAPQENHHHHQQQQQQQQQDQVADNSFDQYMKFDDGEDDNDAVQLAVPPQDTLFSEQPQQ